MNLEILQNKNHQYTFIILVVLIILSTYFSFKFTRINMWIYALDYTLACLLDDAPALYWFKENIPAKITGVLNKDTTTITSHNFTDDELNSLPDINSFSLQNKKILTRYPE